MNKIAVIILFICCCFSNITAQNNFLCILEKLSVKGKEVRTDIKNQYSNYFEALSNNENFAFRNESAIHINNDDQFSIYQIIPQKTLEMPHSNLLRSDLPLVILFDKKNNKCYLIRYSGNDYIYDNVSYHKTIITANFFYNINAVILLNKKLEAETFIVFFNTDVDSDKKGDFAWGGVSLSNQNEFQLFDKTNININYLTYESLMKLLGLSLPDISIKDNSVIKINENKMFSPYEPSFIIW